MSVSRFCLAIACLALGACADLGSRATRDAMALAKTQGFSVAEVEGRNYRHAVFSRIRADVSPVWVFIDGDGSPWLDGGRRIASNPTARNPLALRLAVQTPGSVLYLGRPCYLAAITDSHCTAEAWTQARYSSEVIASMNAALRNALSNSPVVLVGYSGGGTIAALMARDNPDVVAVVTIAANLDIAAWSQQHGYAPLTGSLNPADESALAETLTQLHLIGERDENVAPQTVVRYLRRLSERHVWRFPEYDHVCCWERDWPQIQSRIQQAFDTRSPPNAR